MVDRREFDDDIFRQAVMDHAVSLGMDPVADSQYLWLAEEALLAQLPPEWELCADEEGNHYYYSHKTGQSTWENPLDEPYRQLFQKLKNNPSSSSTSLSSSSLLHSSSASKPGGKIDKTTEAWRGEGRPKGWGQFPGEERIRARASRPMLEKKKRMAEELGLEEKDLDQHELSSSEAKERKDSRIEKIPRSPPSIASSPASPLSPMSKKQPPTQVKEIESHRTTETEQDSGELQYKVVLLDGTREWRSARVVFSDAPNVVHEYNNKILCTASQSHSKKLDDLNQTLSKARAEFESTLNLRDQEFKEKIEQLRNEQDLETGRVKAELAEAKERNTILESRIHEMEASRSKDAGAVVAKRISLENKLKQLEEDCQDLKAQLEEAQRDSQAAGKKVLDAEASLQSAENEVLQWKERAEALEREKERISGDRGVFETMLENVKKELNEEIKANLESRKKLAEMETTHEQTLRELRTSRESTARDLEKLRSERDNLVAELDAMRDQLTKELTAHASSSSSSSASSGSGLYTQAEVDYRVHEQLSLAKEAFGQERAKETTLLETTISSLREQIAKLEDEITAKAADQLNSRELLQASQRKLNRLENEKNVLQSSLDKVKEELQAEFQANGTLRQELHVLGDGSNALKRQFKVERQALEKELSSVQSQLEEAKEHILHLEERLASAPCKRDTELEDEVDRLRKEMRSKVNALNEQLQDQKAAALKATAEAHELQTFCDKLRSSLDEKEQEIAKLNAQLLSSRESTESVGRTKERLNSEKAILQDTVDKLKKELEKEIDSNDKLRQDEAKLRTELSNMSREVQKCKQGDEARTTEVESYKETIKQQAERLAKAEAALDQYEERVQSMRAKSNDETAWKAKKEEYEKKIKSLEQSLARCKQEMDKAIEAQESKYAAERDHIEAQARAQAIEEKDKRITELREEIVQLQEAARSNQAVKQLQAEVDRLTSLHQEHQKVADRARQLEEEAVEIRQRLSDEVRKRRILHNKIVDLQGNIRVYCRVRPVLPHETDSGQGGVVVDFPTEGEILLRQSMVSRDQEDKFEFDQVFAPDTNQQAVFEQVQPLTQSALDGYNVCIFAYGQTGSGKTYTMDGTEQDRGVNYRTFKTLFDGIEARHRENQSKYQVSMSVLEIYNETIRDLLDENNSNSGSSRRPLVGDPKPKKLEVRQGEFGLHVPGLTEASVESLSQVEQVMARGVQNRTVGAHNVNVHSSRSHLVVTINLVAEHRVKDKWVTTRSKLHLIDLAGSERLDKTNASGSMLQEAKAINKSLSALGNVIKALGKSSKEASGSSGSSSSSSSHVPFRDSKLTFLLQDSLSGNSKVLMFVNISPVEWNAAESLCSLTFAARCRKVSLGAAKKNTESSQVAALKKTVEDLQNQLARSTRR